MRKHHNPRAILFSLCLLAASWPPQASAVLPWGSPIGTYHASGHAPAVAAFSNGQWEWYPDRLSGYGKKWQCVEYVNRYYAEVYGLKIEGGDAKYYFKRAAQKGLLAFPNDSAVPPRPGDILCSEGDPYGHVAIVRSVGKDCVHIVQQNWFNDERDLDMVLPCKVEGGRCHLGGFDPKHSICGWLRAPANALPGEQRVVPVMSKPAETPQPAKPASAS
jgi:surface antigen